MDGDEIRARRVALGMSQEELAEATGLSRSFVSHLELNYKKPGDDTAGRLLDVLGKANVPDLEGEAVVRDGEVRFAGATRSVMRLRVLSSTKLPKDAEVLVHAADEAGEGDWVLAGTPGRDRAWFGRLRFIGDTRAIQLDGAGDDFVILTRGLQVLGRATSVTMPISFLG